MKRKANSQLDCTMQSICRADPVVWPSASESFLADFLDMAAHHGITALLWYLHARSHHISDAPDELLSALQRHAHQQAAAEMVREMEVQMMLDALHQQGIDMLLIKGTPLSALLYPFAGLRPRCDTDVLLADGDDVLAAQVLQAHGYDSLFDHAGDFLNSQRSFRRVDESGFTHVFDCHRHISNASVTFSRHLCFDKLKRRALRVPSLGDAAKTLGHSDALLLACMHRAGHYSDMGERLIWLYDIHLLVSALPLQACIEFAQTAVDLQIRGICLDAINAASRWFATDIPGELTQALTSADSGEASLGLLQSGRATRLKQTLVMDMQQLERWDERVKLVMQRLFPPPNYMMWRYQIRHKFLLPYYYLHRTLQGIWYFVLH